MAPQSAIELQPDDTLLVIDMQNDFLAGGPLAVPNADRLIPGINAAAARFQHIIVTQDWHPANHISFASAHPGKRPFADTIEATYGTQTLWPDHCVIDTPGASLHAALDLPNTELILRKGFRTGIDSYSAFVENDGTTSTGLAGYLRDRGLYRLFFCGIATDFCLGSSAIDAAKAGFQSFVLDDLIAGIDPAGAVLRMMHRFGEHQVRQISSNQLAP